MIICMECGDTGTAAFGACCNCPAGVRRRIASNRRAIDAYRLSGREPHCNGVDDLAQRIESIRANPPVPSTLPSLKPVPKPKLISAPEFDNIRTLLVGMALGAGLTLFWCKVCGVIP